LLEKNTNYGKDFRILWDLGISGKITDCDFRRICLDRTNLLGERVILGKVGRMSDFIFYFQRVLVISEESFQFTKWRVGIWGSFGFRVSILSRIRKWGRVIWVLN